MKKLIVIGCGLLLLLASCTDKSKNAAPESPQQIMQMEKENVELQNLEVEIDDDIKELDALLNDLDN